MTDEQAMERVQADGDPRAFADLVRRWEGPIFRLCCRMTGDLVTGEDLKQETFARAFARRMDFRASRARFSTWLWRIAINLCHDELRRRRTRFAGATDDVGLEGAADAAPPPDCVAERHDEADLLRQAVLGLSEPYRSVVLLRHSENLKLREIAEVLGVPEGTVASRLHEGLQQLAQRLRRLFDQSPGTRGGLPRPAAGNQPVGDPGGARPAHFTSAPLITPRTPHLRMP